MKKRDPNAKVAHIDVCLNEDVEYSKSAGFDRCHLVNQAASNVSLREIDLSTQLVGKTLKAPLMIAPMTGGIERGFELNRLWARAAEKHGIAMSVGSQRVGIESQEHAGYYSIRKDAPTAVVFGNIGIAQLCRGWGVEEALRAVKMVEADALFIHLNAIQEACQDGDVDLSQACSKVAELCYSLKHDGIPVFAREVGFGLSCEAAQRLVDAGVSGIDCAGAGGTSWAKVEALCSKSERRRKMGLLFSEWGIPTVQSIVNVRAVSPSIPLIATGGLRSGMDVAKALALGADIGAMARPMLLAAHRGEDALNEWILDVIEELRICMFGIGASNIDELKNTPAVILGNEIEDSSRIHER